MLLLLAGCTAPVVRPRASDPHAVDVAVDEPGQVTCTAGDDARTLTVTDRGVLRGLLADRTYTCTGPGGATASVTTDPLPDDLPEPELLVPNDDVGWFLLQINDDGDRAHAGGMAYGVVLDEQGRVRWHRAGVGGPDVDLTWLARGEILYGGTAHEGGLAPKVIDLDGNVTWEAEKASDGAEPDGWNHDCGLSADGASVYALVREPIGAYDGFVIEQFAFPGGELLWSWASSDHVDELPIDPVTSDADDPWHANALWDAVEADGPKLYVSLRKVSRVAKIDRETGAIEWMAGPGGDFTLLDPEGAALPDTEWFFGQHDVKVIDGRLTLFDNGAYRPDFGGEDDARVVAMDLDEEARTAVLTEAWTERRDGRAWRAYAWGGVDPLEDGGYSVANGAFWTGDPPEFLSAASIVDADGDVAWRVEWSDPAIGLYRTDRVPVGFGVE